MPVHIDVDELPRARGWKAALVTVGIGVLAAAHFLADAHSEALHAFLFKATFLPLVLTGLWFGLRGAVVACSVSGVLYMAHIQWQLVPCGVHDLPSIASDMLLVCTTAVLVGIMSDRRELQRFAALARARELARTTEGLLRAEEHLRRSDRLRSVGELAAGMAHEIRNPLGGIRGAGEILAREGTSPEARAEFRVVLLDEIERLDRVVEAFLRFARPIDGKSDDRIRRVTLDSVLSSVLLLLRGEAERREVRCRVEGAASTQWTGDPDLLRQVLINLCLNALQAMDGGGDLALRVCTAPLSIEVEDQGGGIDPGLREHVFDPFVTGREGGTGLGLATAHRILDAMGGVLRIGRTGPEGTVMVIELAPVA